MPVIVFEIHGFMSVDTLSDLKSAADTLEEVEQSLQGQGSANLTFSFAEAEKLAPTSHGQ